MFKNPSLDKFIAQAPIPNFINGQWRVSQSNEIHEVKNPSDGSTLARASLGNSEDIDEAVKAANTAFPSWAKTSPGERAALMLRLADAIDAQLADVALLESLNVGKALAAAEAFDIPFGAACLRYYADLITKEKRDSSLDVTGMEARVHRAPYGVCGFIFPWNFPFDLLLWGIAPALAAGNTVVVKPSEITPLTSLYFCQLAKDVGFPPGVINVVAGLGSKAGASLASHPLVRRMSFTGSTRVGKLIGEICGRNLIPCKLELGGKGAAVVFENVDVADTAQKLAGAITLNTGQVCCTATRWVVHEKIFDSLVEHAVAALKGTRIGPGFDRETQMGPLASEEHRQRVLSHLDRGHGQGATYLLEGSACRPKGYENGYYVSPSLMTGEPDNACCAEEIFGPSAYLLPFRETEEAVDLVNRLNYGLADSVWSRDLKQANRVAESLNAGNVWINAHNVFAYGLPYGGVNLSGLGGGVNGPDTLSDYLRPKTIARPLS